MLGSRKLLIFGFVSALLLSLLIVGAFAAEPEDVKALGGGGSFKFPPPSDVVVPSNPFKTTYSARSTSSGDHPSALVSIDSEHPIMVHFVYFRPNHQNPVQLEFSEDVPFFINAGSGTDSYSISVNGVTYSFTRWDFAVSFVFGSFSPFSAPLTENTVLSSSAGYLNPIPVFNSILGIGTKLVSFVVARPIVLIPIVAMILVFSYGVIRRLIKGV